VLGSGRQIGKTGVVLVVEPLARKTGLGIRFGTWLLERGLTPKYGYMGVTREGSGGLWEQVYHQVQPGPPHRRPRRLPSVSRAAASLRRDARVCSEARRASLCATSRGLLTGVADRATTSKSFYDISCYMLYNISCYIMGRATTPG
jgi:hypothetical protein